MADEADMTQDRMEAEAELRRKQTRSDGLPPVTGQCLYCGEATAEHFCSTDCRKDWDREQKIRRAQGLA
jgi:hypothetical protein